MILESRYLIVKLRDCHKYLTTTEQDIHNNILKKINNGRLSDNKKELGGLFIEKNWPEYTPTLKLLSDRVDKESENES